MGLVHDGGIGDRLVVDFDPFWKAYPHHTGRSKKMLTRGLFEQITGPGRKTRVDGVNLTLKATAQELIAAAQAYRDHAFADFNESYVDQVAFVPGCQVWLNQGRWEEWIPETQAADNVVGIK